MPSNNLQKKLKYFIQVNIGNELQKSGIKVGELEAFYNYCINEANLEIVGLMIIPPNDNDPDKYFKCSSLYTDLDTLMNFDLVCTQSSSYTRLGIEIVTSVVQLSSSSFIFDSVVVTIIQ